MPGSCLRIGLYDRHDLLTGGEERVSFRSAGNQACDLWLVRRTAMAAHDRCRRPGVRAAPEVGSVGEDDGYLITNQPTAVNRRRLLTSTCVFDATQD